MSKAIELAKELEVYACVAPPAKDIATVHLLERAAAALRDSVDPAKFYGSELFWSLAPEWTTCAAVDASGAAYFYDETPEINNVHMCWFTAEDASQILESIHIHTDWRESLIFRHAPAPEIKVGDRVRMKHDSDALEVIGLHNESAWVLWPSGDKTNVLISNLTPLKGGE